MKLFGLAIVATLFFLIPNWETDFSLAVKKAKEQNKYMLLNFSGSDWCIPCIRLHKELFDSEEFTSFANENLILVSADFPRLKKNQLPKEQAKQNDQLAEHYNPEGTFPLTLLLDKNGKVIKRWEGEPGIKPAAFVSLIKSTIHAGN